MWTLEFFKNGSWRRDRFFIPVERDEALDFQARLQRFEVPPVRVVSL